MKKACFILPYFGKETIWSKYFFRSIEFNASYHWILFTDITFQYELPKNVQIISISLNGFNSLLSKKFQFKTDIRHPYKICDFKPAFGLLFSELLKDYMYWGYCDMDVIFGDLDYFLEDKINNGFDIISPEKSFFPGHFCLCKNHKSVNNLFTQASNHVDVYKSMKCFCFDEFIVPGGFHTTEISLKKKLEKKVRHNRLVNQHSRNIVFKWLYHFLNDRKRDLAFKPKKLIDFNHLISYHTESGNIRSIKNQMNDSDTKRYRLGYKNWKITWKKGKLLNDEGEEILYFHFPLSKYNGSLTFNDHSTGLKHKFTISGSV